jgi:hypothetical protein
MEASHHTLKIFYCYAHEDKTQACAENPWSVAEVHR